MKDVWTLVGKFLQRPVQGQSSQEAVLALGGLRLCDGAGSSDLE